MSKSKRQKWNVEVIKTDTSTIVVKSNKEGTIATAEVSYKETNNE